MKTPYRVLLTLIVVWLASCAVTQWERVEEVNRNYEGAHFSCSLPEGWLRLASEDRLVLSRDGPDLQRIIIAFRPHENAFENLQKESSPLMLPSELAELTIAELRRSQDEGLPSLEILSNEPVDIAGHLGFGLHLVYRTESGLRIEMLLRGFVDDQGLYLAVYRAPMLHYFDRDRYVFDALTASLRV